MFEQRQRWRVPQPRPRMPLNLLIGFLSVLKTLVLRKVTRRFLLWPILVLLIGIGLWQSG